jgi:hypothetical protein
MNTRRSFLNGFFAFPLFAADFWQAKKPSEWSEKEVHKILTDSPWAHSVSVVSGKAVKRAGGNSGGGLGTGTSSRGTSGGRNNPNMGMGGTSPRGTGGGGNSGGGSKPTVEVQIRWSSAKPVKLAKARSQFGMEADSRKEVADMVNQDEKSYIVTVDGLPPLVARGGAAKLKSSLTKRCALVCKGKPDLTPSDVEVSEGGGGYGALVRFPKDTPFTLDAAGSLSLTSVDQLHDNS